MEKFLGKYQNKSDAAKFNAKIFKNIDVNNSKTIEQGEFRVCGMEIQYDYIIAKLQGMFKLIDKNNDQNLTVDEIVKAINDSGEKNDSKFQDVD